MQTNWYRKKADSGRYLSFLSKNPVQQKVSVIKSLTDCTILLTDQKLNHDISKMVYELLLINNYPSQFITKHTNRRIVLGVCKKMQLFYDTLKTYLNF